MVFNSIDFLAFFAVFFALYWFVLNKNLKLQNMLLLLASYFFYCWVDWRFLSLLIAVSALNFGLGIYIEKTTNPWYKRLLVFIGLLQGVGGLLFFKYFNFFIVSFNDAFQLLGLKLNLQTLNIIAPLGISFFTFRTISYVLDVYKEKITSCKDWVIFFTYVSFFPSLLAGPIDKAISFVPQLEKKRVFNYDEAADGLRQIVWGLFKKVVVADNCATVTNLIFEGYHEMPASSLLLGSFFYAVQLYADFSGYSDMAIGFSRLIGFNVTRNFDFPFFAQNIAQFWRKWHISLTSWLTEYVFTPLSIAFRDYDKMGLFLAVLVNFTIVGLWHGANWTYVLFGILQGIYFIPLIIKGTMSKSKKIAKGKILPSPREFINVLGTFTLVMLTLIIFRSETIGQAMHYYARLFSASLFSIPQIPPSKLAASIIILSTGLMFFIEWIAREEQHGLAKLAARWPAPVRWAFYYFLATAIFILAGNNQQFIYFQF